VARVSTSAPAGAEVLAIRPVYAAMREAITATRAAKPEIWTGRDFYETPELMAV
jgi:hypothetical protein